MSVINLSHCRDELRVQPYSSPGNHCGDYCSRRGSFLSFEASNCQQCPHKQASPLCSGLESRGGFSFLSSRGRENQEVGGDSHSHTVYTMPQNSVPHSSKAPSIQGEINQARTLRGSHQRGFS